MPPTTYKNSVDLDRMVFRMIESRAAIGGRMPRHEDFKTDGPSIKRSIVRLIKAGKIQCNISGRNWRVMTVLVGPHAGTQTQVPPHGGAVYAVSTRDGFTYQSMPGRTFSTGKKVEQSEWSKRERELFKVFEEAAVKKLRCPTNPVLKLICPTPAWVIDRLIDRGWIRVETRAAWRLIEILRGDNEGARTKEAPEPFRGRLWVRDIRGQQSAEE